MPITECRFFHYIPNDDNFFHVTCQIISQGSVPSDDHNYDHGFFYNNDFTTNYHVTCKLFSHSSIVNVLNGMEIDINNLKRNELLLTLGQKFNLEHDLKKILPSHLFLPDFNE